MRLLTATDYKRVFEQPVRSADRYFTVLARPASSVQPARLGLAVAKKHVKRAVDRNRLKRLIRESFRQHQQHLTGLDLVVLIKPGVQLAPNRDLLSALAKHWRRLERHALS